MIRCRCCLSKNSLDRIFSISNTPASAQGFLLEEDIVRDKGITLDVSICSNCNVVQLENEPVAYYKDVIRSTNVSDDVKILKQAQFENFKRKYNLHSGCILEVGSGNGDILEIISKVYTNYIGIENSSESVSACVQHGLPVINAYPDIHHKGAFAKDYFDAFIMIMFLEHFSNPRECLEIIKYWIKDGAYGLIEVPNLELILDKSLYTEFVIDHLIYFTPKTLSRFFEANGFNVVELDVGRNDYVITMVVQKRKLDESLVKLPTGLDVFERSLVKLRSYYGSNQVAIWGAGHQALTYLAITRLSDYVKYVIDSSELKQGKYTPVSHKEILSPYDKRVLDEVEIIIVIAGSYTAEIVSIISRMAEKKYLVYIVMSNELINVPT